MVVNGVTTFQQLIKVVKESPAIIFLNRESEKALLKVIRRGDLVVGYMPCEDCDKLMSVETFLLTT